MQPMMFHSQLTVLFPYFRVPGVTISASVCDVDGNNQTLTAENVLEDALVR